MIFRLPNVAATTFEIRSTFFEVGSNSACIFLYFCLHISGWMIYEISAYSDEHVGYSNNNVRRVEDGTERRLALERAVHGWKRGVAGEPDHDEADADRPFLE